MRTVRTFILILMICVTYDIHICLDDKRITRNSRFNLNSISCDGSKSCANADMNIIDATDVSCHGYACINANIILQDCDSTLKSNVYCYGKQSCLNTTIDLGNTTQVNCYIIYSCAHSNMTVSSFASHAYYEVINSVICSDTDTTSHIYLKFDYSVYNLTIFCHYRSIRNIYCDSGLACSGMYLVITNSSINTDNTVSESNYRISNFYNDDWNDTADYYNYKYNKINYNIYKIKNSHSRCPTYILDSVFE